MVRDKNGIRTAKVNPDADVRTSAGDSFSAARALGANG